MRNLLYAELYKLKKNRAFWICLLCTAVLATGTVLMYLFMESMMEQIPALDAASQALLDRLVPVTHDMSGQLLLSQSLTGDNTQLIMGVFVAMFVGAEYTSGFMKNTLSKGFGRGKVLLAKWSVCLIGCVALLLTAVVFNAVTASLLWGFGSIPSGFLLSLLQFLGIQLLIHAALVTVFVTLSTLVHSTSAAIALNLAVIFVASLLNAVSVLVSPDRFFHPIDLILTMQITKMSTFSPSSGSVLVSLLVSVCYLAIVGLLGVSAFQKQDIK